MVPVAPNTVRTSGWFRISCLSADRWRLRSVICPICRSSSTPTNADSATLPTGVSQDGCRVSIGCTSPKGGVPNSPNLPPPSPPGEMGVLTPSPAAPSFPPPFPPLPPPLLLRVEATA